MKRSTKFLINITLIMVMAGIILHWNQYRWTERSAAKIYAESIYLDDPVIELLKRTYDYEIYSIKQDQILACSVVKREFRFLWKPIGFGDVWVNLADPSINEIQFLDQCKSAYDDFYNIDFMEDQLLINHLEKVVLNDDGSFIYRIKDDFQNQFYNQLGRMEDHLELNFKEFIDRYQNSYFYSYNSFEGLGTVTQFFENKLSVYYDVSRYDQTGEKFQVSFYIEYVLNHPENYTVKEVLNLQIDDRLRTYLEDVFSSYETLESLDSVNEIFIRNKIDQWIKNEALDIQIKSMHKIEATKVAENSLFADDLDFYTQINSLENKRIDLDYSLTSLYHMKINEVFKPYEETELLFHTSDGNYVHLNKFDKFPLGEVIKINGTQIQIYLKLSDEDTFNQLLSRVYLQKLLQLIVEDSVGEVKTEDDLSKSSIAIIKALSENFGISQSSISISMIATNVDLN